MGRGVAPSAWLEKSNYQEGGELNQEQIDEIVRKLADEGKLIEAGFVALRWKVIPRDAPEVQVEEMRKAFFAGAQHLFASIMTILEPGEEPTENDLHRLTLISEELEEFVRELKERIAK
jgi:hypothetical protein